MHHRKEIGMAKKKKEIVAIATEIDLDPKGWVEKDLTATQKRQLEEFRQRKFALWETGAQQGRNRNLSQAWDLDCNVNRRPHAIVTRHRKRKAYRVRVDLSHAGRSLSEAQRDALDAYVRPHEASPDPHDWGQPRTPGSFTPSVDDHILVYWVRDQGGDTEVFIRTIIDMALDLTS
jgi:hypothetical protein